jgi:hypothetical protein
MSETIDQVLDRLRTCPKEHASYDDFRALILEIYYLRGTIHGLNVQLHFADGCSRVDPCDRRNHERFHAGLEG